MAKKKIKPSNSVGDGRNENGKFTKGNKFARGNPLAQRVQKLRSALLQAVTPADIKAVVKVLLSQAKAGDIVACRELLDRTLGKSIEADLLDKIQEIERCINEFKQ